MRVTIEHAERTGLRDRRDKTGVRPLERADTNHLRDPIACVTYNRHATSRTVTTR